MQLKTPTEDFFVSLKCLAIHKRVRFGFQHTINQKGKQSFDLEMKHSVVIILIVCFMTKGS